MKKKIPPKRKSRSAKSILRLPDLEVAKTAVINSLSCPDAQRGYRHAIDEFVDWYCSEPQLSFSKTVVVRYRMHLESRHLAPGTINLGLGAVRQLLVSNKRQTMSTEDKRPQIHAKTFQQPLQDLALTISEKVKREGPACFGKPEFVSADLYMMIRHMLESYRMLFYLNADERREKDIHWTESYGVVAAPAVRTMIDCLYNITGILQDPPKKAAQYRKSGLKKRLNDISDDQVRYGGKPDWDAHNKAQRDAIGSLIKEDGFTEQEVLNASAWPTLEEATYGMMVRSH